MKFTKGDLSVMRSSLIALTVAASCSILLIFISSKHADIAEKNWRDAQRQLQVAQSELNAAKADHEDLTNYLDEYAASLAQHLIGNEPRLDWVENLERLRHQKLVLDMHYNIGPQKNYTPQPPINSGNFEIKYSEMKLQLALLHEGQLLDFFAALRSQIKGWYQLDSCSVVRTKVQDGDATASLHAECSGGWITLKNRSTP